jgi:hypothetical protein
MTAKSLLQLLWNGSPWSWAEWDERLRTIRTDTDIGSVG